MNPEMNREIGVGKPPTPEQCQRAVLGAREKVLARYQRGIRLVIADLTLDDLSSPGVAEILQARQEELDWLERCRTLIRREITPLEPTDSKKNR